MGGRLLLSFALIMLAASPVQPFPTGAPAQACGDLRPQHSTTEITASPQTSDSPYELDVEMFEDVGFPNNPQTYSYKPSTTYNRKIIISSVNDCTASPRIGIFINSSLSVCTNFYEAGIWSMEQL